MAFDYNSFVSTVANIMATDPTTPEFVQILPQAIAYAEDRIYRELDILDSVAINATTTFTPNNRNFTLPPAPYGAFLTLTGINVLYGSGPQRQQLQPVAMSYLNAVWGSPTGATLPEYFSMVRQDLIQVGPWPDQAYVVEVVGTFQPEPMSATNPTTFLTTYVPDLLIAGGMIFLSGYMRDFGSQADNPAQAQSWSSQYDVLFRSAMLLELRKRWAGPGWTSLSSVPVTPTR
jgi:hypothetical protein